MCLSSIVKCVTVLCVASQFSVSVCLLLFVLSQVEPSLNPMWFSLNSSVTGIILIGEIEGYPQTKRGRKLKIQPDTMQWWLFFNGPFMCVFFGLRQNNARGAFCCFYFRPQLKILVSEVELHYYS